MANKTIELESGQELELSEFSTKTEEQARKEVADMLIFAVEHLVGFQNEKMVRALSELMNEYLHWLFDATGKHPSVTHMLNKELKQEEQNFMEMRTDLGGVGIDSEDIADDTLANYNRKDGKTDA